MSEQHDAASERGRRAFSLGALLWAFLLTVVMLSFPGELASWLTTTSPQSKAGVILITLGICGGIADGMILLMTHYITRTDGPLLQEGTWDE